MGANDPRPPAGRGSERGESASWVFAAGGGAPAPARPGPLPKGRKSERAVASSLRRGLCFLPRLVADVLPGGLVDLLHAELDFAAVVEAQHLDLHLVADLDDVGGLADTVRRQLADMDEPVARAEEIDEGAEIDRLHHFAGINDAALGLA